MTDAPRLIVRPQVPPLPPARFADTKLLMLVASRGHAVQEALKPLALLEGAGCRVTLAGLDGGGMRFDPLCNGLALLEGLWDPTWRLLRQARRAGRLVGLPSLRALAGEGRLNGWLDGFDGVIVPGGHGRIFGAFLRDPLILETISRFHVGGKIVALICHAPYAAISIPSGNKSLVAGRTVTCWPRAYERVLGLLPGLGRYLVPCGRPVGEALAEAGAVVHDSAMPARRVHAVIDGRLVTGRGPWSTGAFAGAVLEVLAGNSG